MRNECHGGMEVVLPSQTHHRIKIYKTIVLPQKWVIDDHCSVVGVRPPALLAEYVPEGHDVGHKSGKVLR